MSSRKGRGFLRGSRTKRKMLYRGEEVTFFLLWSVTCYCQKAAQKNNWPQPN